MTIRNPLQEPRIHRAFPGGIEDLEVYRQEVVEAIHDAWIDRSGESGRWRYGYAERIFHYPAVRETPIINCVGKTEEQIKDFFEKNNPEWMKETCNAPNDIQAVEVNQLEYVVDTLAKCPHSRRAQIVLWQPWFDTTLYDCPCLQSLFFRIFDDKLIMNIRMRSNDLFKATLMNLWAFVDIQRLVAERLSERLGRQIHQGQVVHMVDSLHLYGSYNEEIKGFLKTLESRTFEQRTFRSDDEMIQEMFMEAKEKIQKSIEQEKETGRKGL